MSVEVLGGPLEFAASVDTESFESSLMDAVINAANEVDKLNLSFGRTAKLASGAFDPNQVNAYVGKLKEAGDIIQSGLIRAMSNTTVIDPSQFDALKVKLAQTNGEFKQLEIITAFIRENINNLNLGPDEIKELSQAIDIVSESFEHMADSQKAPLTRLKELKTELGNLTNLGVSPEDPLFQSLFNEASELQKSVRDVNQQLRLTSSETPGLQALEQGFRGLLGGVQAGASVLGIFNDNEDETAEITKNLVAIMSLFNGVQEIAAVLSKNSAVNTFLQAQARQADAVAAAEEAVAITASNVAQAEGAVVTEAATVAQKGLNAAFLANPAVLILTGLVALYGVYQALSNTIFAASESTKRHKAELEALNEARKASAKAIADEQGSLELLLARARDENATRQQRGKAIDELRSKYPEYLSNLQLESLYTDQASQAIEKQTELIKKKAFASAAEDVYKEKLKKVIEAHAELNKLQEEGSRGFFQDRVFGSAILRQAAAVENINDAQRDANAAFKVAGKAQEDLTGKTQSATDKIQDQIDKIKELASTSAKPDFFKSFIDQLEHLKKALNDATNQPFDPERYEKEKEAALSAAQFKVDVAKKGFSGELKARRDFIEEELAQAKRDRRIFDASGNPIKDSQINQPNTAAQEAIAKYKSQINELNDQFTERALSSITQHAEAVVIALHNAGKEGSSAFFEAQREAIRRAADAELQQAKDNSGQIEKIREQRARDLHAIDLEERKSAIDSQISIINQKLAIVKEGSREELELRLQLIDQTATEEILQAENNQAKIDEIHAKAARDRKDLSKQFDFDQQTIDQDKLLAGIEIQINAERDAFEKRIALRKRESDIKAEKDRIDARRTIKDAELLNLTLLKIDSDAIKEKKDLDDELSNHILENRIDLIRSLNDNKNSKLDIIINDPFTSQARKNHAQIEKTTNEIKALKRETQLLLDEMAHGRGNFDELNKRFEEAEKKANALKEQLKLTNRELKLQSLKDTAGIIGLVGSSLSELAGSLETVNPELAATIQGLSDVSKQAEETINAMVSFGTGDIAGGVTSLVAVITDIINGFAKAAESKRQAQAEILDFETRILVGEEQYNEILRERERQQVKLNKTIIQGLQDQKALLLDQQRINQQTFDQVLAQLQQEDFISGQHTKKKRGSLFGGLVGFFSNTRTTVVNELSSLANKSFEEIEKLFNTGQLTDKAKALFQQLQQLKQEGLDVDALLVQNAQDFKELITGTTAESISDSIADGFRQGKRGIKDFADTFEDLMREAMLQSLKIKFLEEPLKEFFDQFSTDVDSDGQLTSGEIDHLHDTFNEIIQNASTQFEQLQSIADLNLAAGAGPGTKTLSGAIKGITENQAELLAGQFGGLRLTALDHLNISRSSLDVLMSMDNRLAVAVQSLELLITKFNNYETGIRSLSVNVK
jgi:hypothetical protein